VTKRKTTVFTLLIGLVWATGCATTADVVRTRADGMSRVYHVSPTQAWKIAKTVFRWEESDVTEEDRAEGYLVARRGKKWTPWSVLTIAWVEGIDRKHTRVTVVTKRRTGIHIGTTSIENSFHEHFAQALKIIKAGKFLPPGPPV
jgi:hypothetical protein